MTNANVTGLQLLVGAKAVTDLRSLDGTQIALVTGLRSLVSRHWTGIQQSQFSCHWIESWISLVSIIGQCLIHVPR